MPLDLRTWIRGAVGMVDRARLARALRRFDHVGARVALVGDPHVDNLGAMEIGDDVVIVSEPVRVHLATAPGGKLVIGSRVGIGAGSALTALTSVIVEDDVEIGEGVNVIDTDFHDVNDHRSVDRAPKPVRIGRGARVGDRVTVLKGSVIGAGARIAADSVVSGEIGDGEIARGVPARAIVEHDSDGMSVEARVTAIVARVLRVASPALDDGPSTLRGWDSLGSLRLLVAIEDAFAIVLSEKAIAAATSVRSLANEVNAQIARGREAAR